MQKPAMILFDYAHTLAWEPTIPNGFARKNAGLTITGEHLHIHHWHELIDALD